MSSVYLFLFHKKYSVHAMNAQYILLATTNKIGYCKKSLNDIKKAHEQLILCRRETLQDVVPQEEQQDKDEKTKTRDVIKKNPQLQGQEISRRYMACVFCAWIFVRCDNSYKTYCFGWLLDYIVMETFLLYLWILCLIYYILHVVVLLWSNKVFVLNLDFVSRFSVTKKQQISDTKKIV